LARRLPALPPFIGSTRLSREHVARIALQLIDADGLEALSMGRLAERRTALRRAVDRNPPRGGIRRRRSGPGVPPSLHLHLRVRRCKPVRTTDQTRGQALRAAAALPPDEFPNLTTTAAEWTHTMAGTDEFSYGLDRIRDGLQARLEA
jgi:hypothetical protein